MDPIEKLDTWLREGFVAINTQLEHAYFDERVDVIMGRPALDDLKAALLRGGGERIQDIAAMASLPPGSDARYRLLGMVGSYLAACRRHEAELSAGAGGQEAAWTLSLRMGCSLGVAPRFVFAHQALFNDAVAGAFRTFTSLPDERTWILLNASAVMAYRRAAHTLRDAAHVGVSSPLAGYLFQNARAALEDVLHFNQQLSRDLNVDRFYFNIRPYFKSYRVGHAQHRGANAGDFSAINEIDVMLGLCSTADPFYQAIVQEKTGHVPPCDQAAMRALDRTPSLLHAFLRELESHGATPAWRASAEAFLGTCKAHGAAYAYHHQRLVKPFLQEPARAAHSAHSAGVTSSGPPLDEVVGVLGRLMDLRLARAAPGMWSAAPAMQRIRNALAADAD